MIRLWNQTMPHRCPADAFEPYLTPYFCDGAKTAIVVCPGGAYSERVTYEGDDVAVWLNTIGITAFVLEYRVAPSKAPAQPSDAQRAMRLARKLCMEHGIERLGIMGFSAGGHLAATLSVHYNHADARTLTANALCKLEAGGVRQFRVRDEHRCRFALLHPLRDPLSHALAAHHAESQPVKINPVNYLYAVSQA